MKGFSWLAVVVAGLVATACGGGGGGGNGGAAPTPVTVHGRITYDYIPPAPVTRALDFGAAQRTPAVGVTVQAVSPDDTVLAATAADSGGNYSLSAATGTELRIRVLAERRRVGTPGWETRVIDNTSGGALYAMETALFEVPAGGATRDLHAASGWGGSGYTSARTAAPFALLDAVRLGEARVLEVAPDTVFPELALNWSETNAPSDEFRPELGQIVTTSYRAGAIYVAGDAAVDTDEFDRHVVLHEWGHYYENQFSRSDSVGGDHSVVSRLDLRVAYSEGWANAWSAIAQDDPVYSDTGRPESTTDVFRFDIDGNAHFVEGWYAEMTTAGLLWDIYDPGPDGLDGLALGYGPIDAVLRGPQRTTPALTSIYTFLAHLKEIEPEATALLDAMAESRGVIAIDQDIWGSRETNDASYADVLPLYTDLTLDGPTVNICSASPDGGSYNKIGNLRLLRVDLAAAAHVQFEAVGPPGSDPDFAYWNRGRATASAGGGTVELLELQAPAGAQVLEIYEFGNVRSDAPPSGRTCFDVTARSLPP